MRPTRVEIDLSAISHNIGCIRSHTGRRIMMAIKADAYGHGAETVGRYVEEHALADMLGVASIEEALTLRDAGITLPILIFGLISPSRADIEAVITHDLTPTIADCTLLNALKEGAARHHTTVDVHLKTDTGMGRLGLTPKQSIEVMAEIARTPELRLAGTYTHFPVADTSDSADKEFTANQLSRFVAFLQEARRRGIDPGITHCANSGAILGHPDAWLDMVRPGILCYGLYPSDDLPRILPVRPAMTLKTAIMFTKHVQAGTGLSYGLTYETPEDTTIATIPIGYADGYFRNLSNRAHVLIQGKPYPVVGRICMDQCLVDLGHDSYPLGEEVILFGQEPITAETVAHWADTIPYEITCNMSRRVPRMYSGEDE